MYWFAYRAGNGRCEHQRLAEKRYVNWQTQSCPLLIQSPKTDVNAKCEQSLGLGVPVCSLLNPYMSVRGTPTAIVVPPNWFSNNQLLFTSTAMCCSHARVNLLTSLLFNRKQEQIFVKLKHHILVLCAGTPSTHTGHRNNTGKLMRPVLHERQSWRLRTPRNVTSSFWTAEPSDIPSRPNVLWILHLLVYTVHKSSQD